MPFLEMDCYQSSVPQHRNTHTCAFGKIIIKNKQNQLKKLYILKSVCFNVSFNSDNQLKHVTNYCNHKRSSEEYKYR